MKQLYILAFAMFTLAFLCGPSASSQSLNHSDTLFRINPYVEMKKGVVLQSISLAGFGLTAILHITKQPRQDSHYINLGMAYGASAVMFFVGTVYHIQGLNYMYKADRMGHWTLNVSPLGTTVAYSF